MLCRHSADNQAERERQHTWDSGCDSGDLIAGELAHDGKRGIQPIRTEPGPVFDIRRVVYLAPVRMAIG